MKHRLPSRLSKEEQQLTRNVLARLQPKSELSYWTQERAQDEQEWERMQIASALREAERRRSA